MAAAYAFHIAASHPFLDGNKRTAMQTAFMFLYLNGVVIDAPKETVVEFAMALADGRLEIPALACAFERLSL